MNVVSSLRTLWRFRLLIAAIAVASVVIGLTTAYRIQGPTKFETRQYQVGIGSAQALVDTPSSQIADLGSVDTVSVDIATLSTRAGLLANLMTSSPMKDEIAARAGVRPDKLIAVPPTSLAAGVTPGAAPGVTVRASDRSASILKVTIPELQSGQIPIISVRTQAPDKASAGRLADQAIKVLQEHLTTVADDDKVPTPRRVIIRPLGQAQSSFEAHGPSKQIAIVIALALLAFGCVTILCVVALASGWRRATELERSGAADAAAEDDADEDEGDDRDERDGDRDGGQRPAYQAPALLDVPVWAPDDREQPAAEHRV